jgi:nucleoside-diphosphate kinase
MIERTLVLIKPDAVKRKLIGKIISRFEQVDLTIEEMKLINKPAFNTVAKHYPEKKEWLQLIGQKTIESYQKYNFDLKKDLGTEDTLQIGKQVRKWLIEYITEGPIIAIIITGNHAIEVVRKMIGHTAPIFADLGTIRGDFSIDSAEFADKEGRAIYNLVHASGNSEEAIEEITLWF